MSLSDINGPAIRNLAIHREQIRSYDITYMGEVARLFTVAVDREGLAGSARAHESAQDRHIRSLGRHPRTKDVEIPERQRLHSVQPVKHLCILLAGEFLQRVGTQRIRP